MIFNGDLRGHLARLSGFGETAEDVGGGIGTGVGTLIKTIFPGMGPVGTSVYNPNQPGGGYYAPPSWWAKQTTGTKVMIGGVGFLAAAAAISFARNRKR